MRRLVSLGPVAGVRGTTVSTRFPLLPAIVGQRPNLQRRATFLPGRFALTSLGRYHQSRSGSHVHSQGFHHHGGSVPLAIPALLAGQADNFGERCVPDEPHRA
jgi:hypothetical protein